MAKYAHCQLAITDDAGNLMVGASVEVRDEITGNLASLKSVRDGTSTKTNPFTAADGYADFYVVGGAYKIVATLGADTVTLRYRAIGTAAEYDINEVSRYDFIFSSTGLLGDGEALPHVPTPVGVTLLEDLPGSYARSTAAPTAQVVISFEKSSDQVNWVDVFTVTFAIGATVGTFTLAADASLAAGDLLRPVGPATHDATFEGFSATIATLIE